MRFDGSRLFILLSLTMVLFLVLAGVALIGFVRASNYGVRLQRINDIGDMMPELFRE